jgi:hypothetical protein
MLLKPWRNIQTNLKDVNTTWEGAYDEFLSGCSNHIRVILSGIQYFHDCESAALASRDRVDDQENEGSDLEEEGPEDEIDPMNETHMIESKPLNQEGLDMLIAMQNSRQENAHATEAIKRAKQAGIFPNDGTLWQIKPLDKEMNAEVEDVHKLKTWKTQMKRDVESQNTTQLSNLLTVEDNITAGIECTERIDDLSTEAPGVSTTFPRSSVSTRPTTFDTSILKTDQLRAFRIVEWHLSQSLIDPRTPPLRMIIYGEG